MNATKMPDIVPFIVKIPRYHKRDDSYIVNKFHILLIDIIRYMKYIYSKQEQTKNGKYLKDIVILMNFIKRYILNKFINILAEKN